MPHTIHEVLREIKPLIQPGVEITAKFEEQSKTRGLAVQVKNKASVSTHFFCPDVANFCDFENPLLRAHPALQYDMTYRDDHRYHYPAQ